MKKHFKNDCSHCHEYPYGCDDCYSDAKASMNLKARRNKKRDSSKNSNVIYNN
ncbi:hypothetical protein BROSI_A3188 [Candidatus Brocadia sinica JPN1]|uniref:Uncharacterized protein n=1 Tax=Candidatus Brocadia sinica JPN1 TaxID=1197129 RepID=A0ABQ0K1I1_9BACT|nr:hypothetical protein BROSI_A3188 [Candidatus Brocadia sinica JPN1]GIK11670.1 MAG: hypothetical protein BroJett002_03770 [Candidatus Brocadia sinica]GJQ19218.1 MAG: hypothetical protein HBSIN01_31770 [Candidatus Brocadia sinica]